jgi:glycosidase
VKKLFSAIIGAILCSTMMQAQTPFDQPPAWTKDAIWYQIFTERFYNGDTKNDPTQKSISVEPIGQVAPDDWTITRWTQNWYEQEAWARNLNQSLNQTMQLRRYGGDLQGVILKLDYFKSLGINAIYFNPLNHAPSLHKYDASYYHHIDAHFGPDPEGDLALIAKENPADPATWVWTSADKLFLELIKKAHAKGIRIIMDYSWNHTGTLFWAWQDVLKNQQQSKYKDWYAINSFDNQNTPQDEFSYTGWLGNNSLPELKKVAITTQRKVGHPYEGNIHPEVKAHIFAVTERWLKPRGNVQDGVDGFRLDVADQIGLGFWRDFRKVVRAINPDAYLVGEIWWEEWPDKLMNIAPYCKGDVFDAVMWYQVYKPARAFFADVKEKINSKQLQDSITQQWNRVSPAHQQAMMNVAASHDAPRLLTCFGNPNNYKFRATPNDDAAYYTGAPTAETKQRVQLYLLHQFTTVGAPHIYNGEEMGMWGADDPDCRKPLHWDEFSFEKETNAPNSKLPEAIYYPSFDKQQFNYYRQLTALRHRFKALRSANMQFIPAGKEVFMYERQEGNEKLMVILNAGSNAASIRVPYGKYKIVFGNAPVQAQQLQIAPLQGVVLLAE